MKKVLCLVLLIAFSISIFTYGFADSVQGDDNVYLLYKLNILKGNGDSAISLSLDKPVTRLNASIIMLRLLGLESDAAKYNSDSNFNDIAGNHWAKNIMSYIHDNQMNDWGVKDNLFNPDSKVSSEIFIKKLLSILKYEDYTNDSLFEYAKTIGIKSASDKKTINLKEAASLVTEALNIKVNGTKTTLGEYLIENHHINRDIADSTGLVEKLNNNILTMAVAWKQTAAEYNALYYQGFNMARLLVDEATKNQKPGDKPLAVVTDLDDTLVVPLNYWGYIVDNDIDFFNDEIWDEWIPENKMIPTAGSLEFLNYCKEIGVEVFYVTSRDQGENTYAYALENLKALGFPYADEEHLTVLRDTSNKEVVQTTIAEKFNIAVFLGDSLNDFRRIYYVKDVDERSKLVAADKNLFGSKYIIFPNPTDGHWIRAIFGESEPAPSNENRVIWKDAATKSKWERE